MPVKDEQQVGSVQTLPDVPDQTPVLQVQNGRIQAPEPLPETDSASSEAEFGLKAGLASGVVVAPLVFLEAMKSTQGTVEDVLVAPKKPSYVFPVPAQLVYQESSSDALPAAKPLHLDAARSLGIVMPDWFDIPGWNQEVGCPRRTGKRTVRHMIVDLLHIHAVPCFAAPRLCWDPGATTFISHAQGECQHSFSG